MVYAWLALIVGVVYGYMKKGKQDKSDIFKKGLLWGIVIAVVLALLGALLDVDPLGFGGGLVARIIGVFIIMVLFVLGVFIGDWLEHR